MWEQGPSKGTRGKCRRACPEGEVLAVGVVMVTCDGDKNTSTQKRWRKEASCSLRI